MSRCFPYPSPAYAGKCASNDALICTIKRESDKTKSEKKDRRKEKKEKKRKDKSNGTISKEKKLLPADEKLYNAGKSVNPEAFSKTKLQESAYDYMEKSSLTEEHGRPCCSSDSTENSGKRKRQSLHASNNARNPGTVIRIVLNNPQKKEDRPTPSSSNNTSLTLPTVKLDSLSKKADVEAKHLASNLRITPPKSNATQTFVNSNMGKLAPLSKKADEEVKHLASNLRITPPKSNATQQLTITNSNKEKLPCPDKKIDQGSTSKGKKKLPRPLRKYKALFENWVPPSMELDTVNDENDWLLGSSMKEVCQSAKRMKFCKDEVLPNCGNAAMHQPQAHFLSDVDLYALPFTVPF
ncbi:hypothetical protein V2J09_017200 [Rumex salicifolius]